MNELMDIHNKLIDLKERNLYRSLNILSQSQSSHTCINGKKVTLLSSNNYLDLCDNEEVKAYTKQVIDEFGTGSGGSRLTTGSYTLHEILENSIAEFKGSEACLVFNTGYMANLGVISSICDEEYIIYSDELNHASIIDGCRLSKGKIVVYNHNDMVDLEKKLQENPCKKGLIVTDGVFSMDGDIANLPGIIKIAKKFDVLTMVDDAHGTGVIGRNGRGINEYYGVENKVDIYVGTLSKAIGSEGGFVCGEKSLIEYLKNTARSFIFSTALSPGVIASSIKAIEIIKQDNKRTLRLQNNVKYFCEKLKEYNVNVHSETAIIPIIIGDEERTMNISKELLSRGIFVSAIRYPTVKKGSARLRVTLMSSHSREELDFVARNIGEVLTQT